MASPTPLRCVVAIGAIALTVVTACGSDDESAAPSPTTQDVVDPVASAPPETSSDRTVSSSAPEPDPTPTDARPTIENDPPGEVAHAMGTVDVVAEPARVVALDRSLIDAALALELPLAGYTTYDDPGGALPAYFGDSLSYADDAEWVGDLLDPNIEAIASLDPDLILMTEVRHENLYDEFSAIAPTVATESAGGGWKDTIRLVAAVTDRTELAEQVLGDYERRAADVGAAVNEVADHPTVSVVRFVDVIRLYQPVSFSGVVLEDAGIARPESQQDRDEFIRIISEEELELADADVLIYTVAAREEVEEMADDVRSRALWTSLSAVQEDSAYPVLDDSWMSGVGVFGAHLILDDLERIFQLAEPGSTNPTTTTPPPSTIATTTQPAPTDDSITGVAEANGATFIPTYADLAPTFAAATDGQDPITVLMPDDEAFLAFTTAYPDLTERLRADFELLDAVLSYHVLVGSMSSAELAATTEVTTLQGEAVTVEVVGDRVVFNEGQGSVEVADLDAANGTVHVLDGILLPPSIAADAS